MTNSTAQGVKQCKLWTSVSNNVSINIVSSTVTDVLH